MSKKMNQTKNIYQKIHNIFLRDWDPIGIQNIPEAQDEYDGYVSNVFNLLISGKSQKELFEYLWWVETEHINKIKG